MTPQNSNENKEINSYNNINELHHTNNQLEETQNDEYTNSYFTIKSDGYEDNGEINKNTYECGNSNINANNDIYSCDNQRYLIYYISYLT